MTCKYFRRPDIKSLLPRRKQPLKYFQLLSSLLLLLLLSRYSPWDTTNTQLMWHQPIQKQKKRQEILNCQPENSLVCWVKCDTMFQLHLRARTSAPTIGWFDGWENEITARMVNTKYKHKPVYVSNFAAIETWLVFLFTSCFSAFLSLATVSYSLVFLIENLAEQIRCDRLNAIHQSGVNL